jgi:hypothetical protein
MRRNAGYRAFATFSNWPGPSIRQAKLTGRFMRFADTGFYAVDRRLVR